MTRPDTVTFCMEDFLIRENKMPSVWTWAADPEMPLLSQLSLLYLVPSPEDTSSNTVP